MGAVLKSNMIEGLGAKMVRFSLADVRMEAAAILQKACDELERAKGQALQIIEEAKVQAQAIRQTAQDEGRQAGLAQGTAEGTQHGRQEGLEQAKKEFTEQNRQLRTTLEAVLANFESQRDHLLAQAHQDLLALALAIAVKVTRRQLATDPAIVLENAKAAAGLVASRSRVVLRMNPIDIDRFELLDSEKAATMLKLAHVQVVRDDAVAVGGCVLETENGKIDAQVATQLDNLIHQLAPDMGQSVNAWAAEPTKG